MGRTEKPDPPIGEAFKDFQTPRPLGEVLHGYFTLPQKMKWGESRE